MSESGVEKENSTERRNEGKSAAYDTESNPAISCTSSQRCSALSIYGDGICMKGKPRLMDLQLVLKFLCIKFWENVWFHSLDDLIILNSQRKKRTQTVSALIFLVLHLQLL